MICSNNQYCKKQPSVNLTLQLPKAVLTKLVMVDGFDTVFLKTLHFQTFID